MKIKLLVVACAAALLATACGGGASSSSDGPLRFWLSGDANQGGGYQAMAEKYQQETGVAIKIEDIPYGDFMTRLRQAGQADDLPDIGRVPAVDPLWANQLQDLSQIATDHQVMPNLLVKDEDGKTTTLPSDLTAVGMFLNKSLFDKAGVAYPTGAQGNWTWDQFVAALRQVKAATGARYGMVMDKSSHRLRSLLYQFGSDGFPVDDACRVSANAATTKGLQFFADLNDDDIMPRSVWVSGDDPNALFKSGQVAAYYSGVWQVTDFAKNIKDFQWVSVPMPAQPVRATNLGTNLMVAFDGKNAEASRAFVDWLYTPQHYQELAEISGFLPVLPGLDIRYRTSADSYALYNAEIAASDPISGYQITSQLKLQERGTAVQGDPVRAEAVKLANGEQDVPTTIANIIRETDEELDGCR